MVSDPPSSTATDVAETDRVSFEMVRPIFERRCVRCHSDRAACAGLNFQDRNLVLTGGRAVLVGEGPRFLVPGNPEQSLIFNAILKPTTHPQMMPNDGWKLSQRQLTQLYDWIVQGAPWPEGRAGRLKERR